MDALEEQIILTTEVDETAINSGKSHNPGLKALLSIKKFTATLEKDFTKLLQTESELLELNKVGLLMLEATTSPELAAGWKAISQEINKAISGINATLTEAKKKASPKRKNQFCGFVATTGCSRNCTKGQC